MFILCIHPFSSIQLLVYQPTINGEHKLIEFINLLTSHHVIQTGELIYKAHYLVIQQNTRQMENPEGRKKKKRNSNEEENL